MPFERGLFPLHFRIIFGCQILNLKCYVTMKKIWYMNLLFLKNNLIKYCNKIENKFILKKKKYLFLENDNIILRNSPAIRSASYRTDTTSYSVDRFLLTDGLLNKSNCQSFAEVHVPTVVRIFVNTQKYYSIKKIKFHMLFDSK